MKIHIIGSGAIGGMAGAFMLLANRDVTFVDQWPEHIDAINDLGLTIDGIKGRSVLPARAIHIDDLNEEIDVAFVAVKSQHTEEAIRKLQPNLGPNSIVVSLQNGFNAFKIGELIGTENVLGTVPDYTAALVAPGFLEYTVEGPVYVGELTGDETERVREVQGLLSHVAPTNITSNIVGRIWTKQCYMSQIVMSALVDASFQEVMTSNRNRLLGVSLVRESVGLADRAQVTLEEDQYFRPVLLRERHEHARREQVAVIQSLMDHFDRKAQEEESGKYEFVKKGSGMWWDIVYRRRPSETPWITGALVQEAEELGYKMPLNQAMIQMIYEIEEGRRSLGWQNIDELASLASDLGEPLEV